MRARSNKPPTRRGLASWLAELDAAHALAATDSAETLRRIDALPTAWVKAPPAERALLEARRAAVEANTHYLRGEYEPMAAAAERAFVHAGDAALQAANATLLRELRPARRSGHNLRAILASRRGDDPAALRDFFASLALAREHGDPKGEARSLVNLANVYGHIGLEARALELHRQALVIAQRLQWRELIADIHHNIAAALGGCGELEAAVASHRLALAEFAALGLRRKMVYPHGALCERLVQLGRYDEAVQALSDTWAVLDESTEPAVHVQLAYLKVRLAMLRRDWSSAHDDAEASLEIARLHGIRHYEGQAHLHLGRIAHEQGRFDAARDHALQALAAFEQSALREEMKAAHELLSGIAEAHGDHALALEHLRRFHALHCELAEGRSALQTKVLMVEYEVELARSEADRQRLENARLTEALAQIGARLQASEEDPARVMSDGPATPQDLMAFGLTRREADVLFWVTQGKTNAEVVEILGTGMPAVKKHLSRIFDKLGVDNRTAASSAVRRRRPG